MLFGDSRHSSASVLGYTGRILPCALLNLMNLSAMPAEPLDGAALLADLRRWSLELGFARLGVANIDLAGDEAHLIEWLRAGFNGEMAYMSRHGLKRSRPAELLPGTVTCVSVRMDYWPREAADAETTLADPEVAYV